MNVNAYINMNKKTVNSRYRHRLHLMPPIGWMNDPNGFSIFQGEYHMFYQYYPYDTKWGPMYWGHATSDDLINWEDKPVALEPGEAYDEYGAFSGTAIEVDGILRLYYTGHREKPEVREVQCLATSEDGIQFEKFEGNPVISSDQVGHKSRIEDFRDPKVWKHEGKFYMVTGSRTKDYQGQILFYTSDDGYDWEYRNYFTLGKEYGVVWECPDIFELDGKTVIIFSPQWKPRVNDIVINGREESRKKLENIFTTFALIGSFNYETCQFSLERVQDFDNGFDFYAPQSILDKDGNRVLMAWMNMWQRKYVLDEMQHGWNGSLTLPRKLSIKDGRIYQWPIEALNKYRSNLFSQSDLEIEGEYRNENLAGVVADIEITFEMTTADDFEIGFFEGENEELILYFDRKQNIAYLKRHKTKRPIINLQDPDDFIRSCSVDCSEPIHIRAVLDVSSVEIFINDGETAMTSLFFPDEGSDGISLRTSGRVKVNTLSKWDMVI